MTSTGTEASANPYQYQGGYHDTTGFDKFGDRYYNPTTAIWTQPDPKTPSVNNPASYLLYSFDTNNPINNSDPTGAEVCSIDECLENSFQQGIDYGLLGGEEYGLLSPYAAEDTGGLSIPVGFAYGSLGSLGDDFIDNLSNSLNQFAHDI